MKAVSVYLGSSPGKGDRYLNLAREVGRTLARKGVSVVFGGAAVGTMKALADGALGEGGSVIGVFPEGFGGKREVQHQHIEILYKGMTECIFVRDLAERKARMEEMSDCALVLPGSLGTMDECFSYGVNNEIAVHDKIVYILNAFGYYDGLKKQLETFVEEGFLPPYCLGDAKSGSIIRFISSVDELPFD